MLKYNKFVHKNLVTIMILIEIRYKHRTENIKISASIKLCTVVKLQFKQVQLHL